MKIIKCSDEIEENKQILWRATLTAIGSDNGLLPGRRHAIIWTNARILLIRA